MSHRLMNLFLPGTHNQSTGSGTTPVRLQRIMAIRDDMVTPPRKRQPEAHGKVLTPPVIDRLTCAPTWGIVYVAFGANYNYQAAFSARSVRKYSPIPICVFTNCPMAEAWDGIADVTVRHLAQHDRENRNVKTDMFTHSPFERTLYLDTDTAVRSGAFLAGFAMLGEYDVLAIAPDPPLRNVGALVNLGVYQEAHAKLGYTFPVLLVNGGVMFFRKNAVTQQFFGDWNGAWAALGRGRDMPALAWALQQQEKRIKLGLLPLTWNDPHKRGGTVIAHAWGKHRHPDIPDVTKYKPDMHNNGVWRKRRGSIDVEEA